MNGYQRIRAALEGRLADRVPILLHNFPMAARESGLTQAEFRSDPRRIAEAFIRAAETYEADGILVDIDTATLAGAAGAPVDFPEDEPARVSGGCIDDLEGVRDLEPVDIQSYRPVRIWLEATALIRERCGDDLFVRGNCDQCPFTLASQLRSPETWMMDLCDEKRRDLVHDLLRHCEGVTGQFLRLMAEAGAHMLSNGDSAASPDLISPRMFREFALPSETRIVETAHGLGLPYTLHICGDTSAILEDMASTGADGLEIDHRTDALRARRALADRTVFLGNIDPSGVLALGSPDLVDRKTRELLEIFGGTPRFILNAGCAIPATTPPENLRAMVAAARAFR